MLGGWTGRLVTRFHKRRAIIFFTGDSEDDPLRKRAKDGPTSLLSPKTGAHRANTERQRRKQRSPLELSDAS